MTCRGPAWPHSPREPFTVPSHVAGAARHGSFFPVFSSFVSGGSRVRLIRFTGPPVSPCDLAAPCVQRVPIRGVRVENARFCHLADCCRSACCGWAIMSSPNLPRDKRQKRAPDADADEGTNRRWRAAHRYGMPPSPELDCRPTLSATPLSWICGRGFMCTYSGNTQFLVVCLFLILTGGRGGWAFVLWPALERAGEAPARARGDAGACAGDGGTGGRRRKPSGPGRGRGRCGHGHSYTNRGGSGDVPGGLPACSHGAAGGWDEPGCARRQPGAHTISLTTRQSRALLRVRLLCLQSRLHSWLHSHRGARRTVGLLLMLLLGAAIDLSETGGSDPRQATAEKKLLALQRAVQEHRAAQQALDALLDVIHQGARTAFVPLEVLPTVCSSCALRQWS